MKRLFLFVALTLIVSCSVAQSLLNKTVSVNVTRQPLARVLDNIGSQGNFHFSYILDFIRDDSLVTLNVNHKTVKQVLDIMFQGTCQYKEIGNQLIIQRAAQGKERWYVVSGYITDAVTGHPVSNASVYERMQLISAMTNEQGYFRLKLREKDRPSFTSITVSKDLYKDTAMLISSGYDQEMVAGLKPAGTIQLSVVDVNQFTRVEQTWLGSFFLSSKQRMQSLNLSDFFTRQPYQSSIIPGLGTHGKLGAQVVNKVSLNLIGGYTAGLNGYEVAGVFNIDKKDVRYVQFAGVFNVVGGKMTGMQASGLHNHVLDSLTGVQIAGISNIINNNYTGMQAAAYNQANGNGEGLQVAGILNITKGKTQGVQLAGGVNYTRALRGMQVSGIGNIVVDTVRGAQFAGGLNYVKKIHGIQVAGTGNIATDTVRGLQVSGLFNYAGTLKGVQIGVVNIADSSDGYSIGLLNFVRKGYHQLAVYHSEIADVTVAFKSGNHKLYTILLAGANLNSDEKVFITGFGLGHIFRINRKMNFALEYLSETVYLGDWENTHSLNRLQSVFNFRLAKGITLFGGPAFSLNYAPSTITVPGYKASLPGGYKAYNIGDKVTGWFGWHLGIGFF
ncbi:hypothetical protein SAMN05518672_10755 [Chitinophaga sp. CF118]|uniref:STN and carboxypeptidase regulatory-like domain-containing protein n=1 Tax=Chitinophaga sp. CF118 TaxID=1884367 RepID=UPI0008E4F3CF|nr:STN and carboxypeptidase regulatory-like domain-containing protein [Chitinophaga sp. CF118]SFE51352.1 hypothetical protein SAMN05518672_10755 [Chitinophaga sp. CF118]